MQASRETHQFKPLLHTLRLKGQADIFEAPLKVRASLQWLVEQKGRCLTALRANQPLTHTFVECLFLVQIPAERINATNDLARGSHEPIAPETRYLLNLLALVSFAPRQRLGS